MRKTFDTPILFLIFNRPIETKKVFNRIRKIQPKSLFVAGDGPRSTVQNEKEICFKTRQIILNGVDWECNLQTLFQSENLGCGYAVSEAIRWFFKNVEEGIILEDDTLPDISFFFYCQKLLLQYRDCKEIMHISGNSFYSLKNKSGIKESYYFSSFPFIWGWASWRRAWKYYDFDIIKKLTSIERSGVVQNIFLSPLKEYWIDIFEAVSYKEVSFTWDYQWFLSMWKNKGLAILPKNNLVKNIGWGKNATHTIEPRHHLGKLKTYKFKFPLVHPKTKIIKPSFDEHNFKNYYLPIKSKLNFSRLMISKTKSLTKNSISFLKKKLRNVILKFLPEIKDLLSHKEDLNYHFSNVHKSDISIKAKLYFPGKFIDCSIGDYSYVAPNALVVNTTIGKFCSIGPNFCSGYGIHPTSGISTSPMFYSTKKQNGYSLTNLDKIVETKKIIIGNDVFIGRNVTVLDGVQIGNGAIIGACAIVSKDIPAYAIAVGNPIKIIKYRFSPQQIEKLLKINWWDFEENKLSDLERDFLILI